MFSIQEWIQRTINENLKEMFLWDRVNEHVPPTGILEPLYTDSLTFTGWRSGLGDKCSKLLTLLWARVSILQDIGVPLDYKVIFHLEGLFLICEMLTKVFGFLSRFIVSRKNSLFVNKSWFSFSIFNIMESFSISWTALLKIVFHITVMTNFSIGMTFTAVVRIFAKLIFHNYVFSLSGVLTSRFWMY